MAGVPLICAPTPPPRCLLSEAPAVAGVRSYMLADMALELAQLLAARLQAGARPRARIPHTPGRVVLPTMLYTMLDSTAQSAPPPPPSALSVVHLKGHTALS